MDLIERIEMIQLAGAMRSGKSSDEAIAMLLSRNDPMVIFKNNIASYPELASNKGWILELQLTLMKAINSEGIRTKYEDLVLHKEMIDIWDELVRYAPSSFPDTRPIFATTDSGHLNAYLLRDEDTFAIVADRALISGLAHLVAKLVASALIESDANGQMRLAFSKERLSSSIMPEEVYERFFQIFLAYARTGNPFDSKKLPAPLQNTQIIDLIRNGMQMFLIGHEMGHLSSGHFDDPIMMMNDEFDLVEMRDDRPIFLHRHSNELASDAFSIGLVANYSMQYGALGALLYAGAMCVFHAYEAAERVAYLLSTKVDFWDRRETMIAYQLKSTTIPCTHPTPSFRRMQLRESFVRSNFPSEMKQAYLQVSDFVDGLFMHLLDQTKSRFLELSEAGVRCAPTWNWLVAEFPVLDNLADQIAGRAPIEAYKVGWITLLRKAGYA